MCNVKIWECFDDVDCTGRCRQQPEALESVEVLGWWPRWYLDREARLDGCGNVWNVAFTLERWSSEYVHMIYARYYKVANENLQFEDRAWSYCVPRHHWGGPEGHHAETRHRLDQQLQQTWKMRGFFCVCHVLGHYLYRLVVSQPTSLLRPTFNVLPIFGTYLEELSSSCNRLQ